LFRDTSLMKITFKVCFLLGSGTQGKGKLKRGHIREKNFSNGTKENTIFFNGTEGILSSDKRDKYHQPYYHPKIEAIAKFITVGIIK
jgi:hypothetical protein